MFEEFDFSNFWEEYDDPEEEDPYHEEPPSKKIITEIEEELGYKLPKSYIWLMNQYNGGTLRRDTIRTSCTGGNFICWLYGMMGIGKTKSYSLCGELGSKFMIEDWGYPNIGIAICNTYSAGHQMIFLDYRECGPKGEPKVSYVDQENDFKITIIADNFEEFVGMLEEI